MMRRFAGGMLAGLIVHASSAFALFDVQVLTGKRDTSFEAGAVKASSQGNELKAAAHLDPIPLVPVGFGVSLSQLTYDSSAGLGVKSIEGAEFGAEVTAWLPIGLMGFVPYGKLGYTLGGAYVAKLQPVAGVEPSIAFKSSGSYMAVGLKYEFLLRLGVMLEYEMAQRKLGFDKVKTGTGDALKTDLDADSKTLLLGIQAGL